MKHTFHKLIIDSDNLISITVDVPLFDFFSVFSQVLLEMYYFKLNCLLTLVLFNVSAETSKEQKNIQEL